MSEFPADTVQSSLTVRHGRTIGLVLALLLFAVLYIGLIIGIWMYVKNSKGSGQGARTQGGERGMSPIQTAHSVPIPPVVTPTPRPTGPGQYACSPLGTCKDYSDEVRQKSCTVTFADRLCLDQCSDPSKQCKN